MFKGFFGTILGLGLAGFCSAAELPAGKVVFHADFDSSDALAPWGSAPRGVSLGVGRSGTGLMITRSAAEGPGTVVVSTSLPVDSLLGCQVRCEAQVRADAVAEPPKPWNGIKVMLHTDSPSEGKRWDQQQNVHGTFDWRTVRFTVWVPPDATLARLILGLEDTRGRVWFDEVKVTVLKDPRDVSVVPARTGPVFKGHDQPRLRGAMVQPDISAESLRVLGSDWKANVLRWQLIRYVASGKETTLGEYDIWLENELAKLDRALPLCAAQGVKVVVDLHSPPGGMRTQSGYIGSDGGLFTNSAAQAKFVAVWQHMARRYRDNPSVWGYDLANEPVEEGDPGEGCDNWQALATRAAKAIRAIDSRHAIIVEPAPWGGPAAIRNLDPLPVEGVVYSVHMYVPHEFTHQGVQGQGDSVTYPGMIAGRAFDKSALRRTLQPVIDFQARHRVHVFVGEFSAIRWAPGATDYLRDCIALFEENSWDWTYHAFREYQGWSVEYGEKREDLQPAVATTDRQRLLLEWFGRNGSR